MEAITIPHVRIPSINIGGICLPGIGSPGSIGKKGLVWPAGMKEHIKAWYDPKKQGLTNYDVIEAYTEDFKKWNNSPEKYTGSLTSNSLALTNISQATALIYSSTKPYDFKVLITGLQEGQHIKFGFDYGETILEADKDGVYTIEWKEGLISYGIYTNFVGECNITITQLPTSILKDLSGNGNHAYLYGGKGKLNSGMGVYQEDFTTWSKIQGIYELGANSFNWKYSNDTNTTILTKGANETKSMKVIIEGLSTNILQYAYYEESVRKILEIKQDGEYVLPFSESNSSQTWNGFAIIKNEETVDITITQIPDYPDQLYYDGKTYAVCYGFPILTDYTVMAERTWFEKEEYSAFISNSLGGLENPSNGAFSVELKSLNSFTTISFGSITSIGIPEKGITYQTKQSYNGNSINVGTKESNDILILGSRYFYKNNNTPGSTWTGCHGAIIVADRSFTEEEINWLKNNLFTIDIPTPAYDFDFSKYKDGSNLGDSITDKYGNVLELHNFAWKGMSGLGGYPIDLKATFPRNYTDGRDYICNDKEITCSYIGNSGLFQVLITNQDITKYIEIPEFTIKISGSENINLVYFYIKEDFTRGIFNIIGNGIYKIPKSYKADKIVENLNWLGFVLQNHMNENVDFKLEILPVYPGALVFDGVDDYAKLAKMTIKTVIIDFVNLELDKQVYDNRDKPNNHNYFSIYPQADTVAYEARNSNGKTYINGELNTTIKTNDLLGVRCITCASNDLAKETEQYICRDSYLNNYYGKIALYRITGFTEMLTADQVWKWYQKNKAKGGDK